MTRLPTVAVNEEAAIIATVAQIKRVRHMMTVERLLTLLKEALHGGGLTITLKGGHRGQGRR